jgi:hypothetical protein
MSFTIRTKLPNKGNKFYNTTSAGGYSHCIKGKPTQSGLNVLDNCVGWACGRFNEVYSELTGYKGMKYYQLNCNAEKFIKRGKAIGLKVSKEPVAGGIMVWEGKGKLAGHVAFVEKKNSATQVFTSESGYNHFAFANYTRNKGSNKNWGANTSTLKYLGCLINPGVQEDKYTKGIYHCNYNMYIRKKPNGKPVKVKDCTSAMSSALTSKDPNADAIVKKGTNFTALSIVKDGNGYWAKNYSGYICIDDGKTQYCKKN